MSGISDPQKAILDNILISRFASYLPPLLSRGNVDEDKKKNIARSLSAFFLSKYLYLEPKLAAQSVVDDSDDMGIDAIFYSNSASELYIVQAKHKTGNDFVPDDALKFIEGARKIINQDFEGFNKNFLERKEEICSAIECTSKIFLAIIHSGPSIDKRALRSMNDFIQDVKEDEPRISEQIIDFGPREIENAISQEKAVKKVNGKIYIAKHRSINTPKSTHFGIVKINELIDLHNSHGRNLYHENIRGYLGRKTDVNSKIENTLRDNPGLFFYLNNGVTAIAEYIEEKGDSRSKGAKRIDFCGLSIINGAQTIASSAKFLSESPNADLTDANVLLTIIEAPHGGEFGKNITKARNHQNPVNLTDFAALDETQEKIRRELAHLNYRYANKPGSFEGEISADIIHIDDAAVALAFFRNDPRYPVWIKRDFSTLKMIDSRQYREIFTKSLNPYFIVNAVSFFRIGSSILSENANSPIPASEKAFYRHGNMAILWIVAKLFDSLKTRLEIIEYSKLKTCMSRQIDEIRHLSYEHFLHNKDTKGPLGFFKNSSYVTSLLKDVLIQRLALTDDPEIKALQLTATQNEEYPRELFQKLFVAATLQGATP